MTTTRRARPGSDEAVPIPERYRVLGRIGTSRTGDLYLCGRGDDTALTRPMLVKVVHSRLTDDRAFTQVLLRELRSLGRMSHPNLLGLREIAESGGRYCIVTPYLEGGSMAEFMAQTGHPLPVWFAVQAVIGALNGLHAAHSAMDETGSPMAVVHGQVSPDNIYLDTYGNARMSGFGFATAASASSEDPSFDASDGIYIAPEYLLGRAVDHRADVFSAGAVLWGALVGKPLFTHPHELLDPVVPPPSGQRTDIPRWFDPICTRAMRVDPAHRYQSAAEMARAIHDAAASASITGSSQRVGERVAEVFARRIAQHRKLVRDARGASQPSIDLGLTQGMADEPSSPAIPVGVYFRENFGADTGTGSWPFVDRPAELEPPQNLSILQPGVQSRQRRQRAVGIAVFMALLCIAVGLGLALLMRGGVASESASEPTRSGSAAPVVAPAAPAAPAARK